MYRERREREGQDRRDLESERKSERKRKKKAAAGKKPAAAPIRQTSLRSSEAQGSGLRTQELRTQDSGAQDSGAQDLINLIGICVSYKWYAGDLGSFPTQAGKIASVQVIQSELARAGHELLQALRQSGHVAIDPHR